MTSATTSAVSVFPTPGLPVKSKIRPRPLLTTMSLKAVSSCRWPWKSSWISSRRFSSMTSLLNVLWFHSTSESALTASWHQTFCVKLKPLMHESQINNWPSDSLSVFSSYGYTGKIFDDEDFFLLSIYSLTWTCFDGKTESCAFIFSTSRSARVIGYIYRLPVSHARKM